MPETLWDTSLAYAGVNDAYSCHSQSYNSRGRYYTSGTNDIKMVQAFLTFVPEAIKNRQFYYGLFTNTKLASEHIDLITPLKHKSRPYYLQNGYPGIQPDSRKALLLRNLYGSDGGKFPDTHKHSAF